MRLDSMLVSPALAGLNFLRWLAPAPAGAFRILLFHDITESQERAFSSLIDHISHTSGFLTPAEAAERLATRTAVVDERVPCLLSFDDGFSSNRRVAETVLRRHGISGLFFVCPGLVDLPSDEWPAAIARGIFDGRVGASDRRAQRPLMTWEDIRVLAAAGHEIGAHSMTHRRLAGLDRAAVEAEVAGSCERLRQVLGHAPRWFAWPFGDIASVDAPALGTIAQNAHFCRSGVRGINQPGQSRLTIFAEHVDLDTSELWQRLVVAGGLDGRYRAARATLAALAEAAGRAPASP